MTSSPGLQVASTPKNRNGLAPGRDDDVARIDLEAAVAREVRGAGLAQHGQSRRGAVVRLAVGPGLAAGVDDVARRREVGLADLQVDDPPARRLQRLRAREHLEGGFRTQAVEAVGELHQATP